MKRLLTLTLALVMSLSLTACGGSDDDASSSDVNDVSTSVSEPAEDGSGDASVPEGRISDEKLAELTEAYNNVAVPYNEIANLVNENGWMADEQTNAEMKAMSSTLGTVGTAITEYDFSQVDLDALLDGYDWLHLSGITPALAPNCRTLILDMLKVAKNKSLTVSFDGNFRSTLWSWEEARDFCTECLPYVDVLLGIEPYHLWKDESDHSKGDWKDGVPLQPSYEQQDEIFQHFIERYPNLKCIARHVRYAHSGSENSLKAFMWYDGHTFESKLFTFNILDRVGGGDAFASGLIYAMLHNYRAMDMINFAVASSAIKHTIHGDANITDDVSTIRNLMNMNYDIKR